MSKQLSVSACVEKKILSITLSEACNSFLLSNFFFFFFFFFPLTLWVLWKQAVGADGHQAEEVTRNSQV